MIYYIGWLFLVGISLSVSLAAFIWALRAGQFSDQERARYLPLGKDLLSEPIVPVSRAKRRANTVSCVWRLLYVSSPLRPRWRSACITVERILTCDSLSGSISSMKCWRFFSGAVSLIMVYAAWASYPRRRIARTEAELEERRYHERESGHHLEKNPIAPFLIFTYLLIAAWSVSYLIYVWANGSRF